LAGGSLPGFQRGSPFGTRDVQTLVCKHRRRACLKTTISL